MGSRCWICEEDYHYDDPCPMQTDAELRRGILKMCEAIDNLAGQMNIDTMYSPYKSVGDFASRLKMDLRRLTGRAS